MINIYTDGSCHYNPGPGGFSVIILSPDKHEIKYKYTEFEENTTNNRMELKAVLHALKIATEELKSETVFIYSDSAYVVNIFNDWIYKWSRNDWKNSKNLTIENLDLIQPLYKYCIINFPNYQVMKVTGHQGIVENELADALCTNNQAKFAKILKKHDIIDLTVEK